jgi:hypothetical protein
MVRCDFLVSRSYCPRERGRFLGLARAMSQPPVRPARKPGFAGDRAFDRLLRSLTSSAFEDPLEAPSVANCCQVGASQQYVGDIPSTAHGSEHAPFHVAAG